MEPGVLKQLLLLEILLVVVVLNCVDDLGEDGAGGGGDAQLFAVFGDLAVEDVDLGLTLMHQHILAHGGVIVADVGDYVVYPKHGVGRVIELQSQEIAGMQLELYVLRFEKERMTLRVPVNKVEAIGMRKLSSDKTLKEAMETLKGKPKVKRTMWSRRAQEYEAKINSGDLVSIAEVTRDLFRADDQPEQSYSERQIFEAASSRLARELAAMEESDEKTAQAKILQILNEHAPKYYLEKAV